MADEQQLTPKQTGLLSALDFWMYAAEAMFHAANRQNDPNMEAASKAQDELEKIEAQIEQLQGATGNNPDAQKQLQVLHDRVDALRRQMSGQLTAWERTELARHPNRPYPLDYIERMFSGFSEIHGDRTFGDDAAMICGMANFRGREVLVLGTQKGRDTKQRSVSQLRSAESRGLSQGAARDEVCREVEASGDLAGRRGRRVSRDWAPKSADRPRPSPTTCARWRGWQVPFIAVITGEGGSGGALAIAVADRVLMLENSIYSVISPEGCASIMWRDSSKKDVAAQALRITAKDNLELGICDEVITEPAGGAHHDHDAMAKTLGDVLEKHLSELEKLSTQELLDARYKKFREMAQYFEVVPVG